MSIFHSILFGLHSAVLWFAFEHQQIHVLYQTFVYNLTTSQPSAQVCSLRRYVLCEIATEPISVLSLSSQNPSAIE